LAAVLILEPNVSKIAECLWEEEYRSKLLTIPATTFTPYSVAKANAEALEKQASFLFLTRVLQVPGFAGNQFDVARCAPMLGIAA